MFLNFARRWDVLKVQVFSFGDTSPTTQINDVLNKWLEEKHLEREKIQAILQSSAGTGSKYGGNVYNTISIWYWE